MFLKRIFAWPFRSKQKPEKDKNQKVYYIYRGEQPARKRPATPSRHDRDRDHHHSASSDIATWPTPEMLAELSGRRAVAFSNEDPIPEAMQTRPELFLPSPIETSSRLFPESANLDHTSASEEVEMASARSPPNSHRAYVESEDGVVPPVNGLVGVPSEDLHLLNSPVEHDRLGHASMYTAAQDSPIDRPTYNVTVHRKKLHAITQFPEVSISEETTPQDSFASSTASHISPHQLPVVFEPPSNAIKSSSSRRRPKSLDPYRLQNIITDDPALLEALRLYYGKDPSQMFKNSPIRPELGPRSASAGNVHEKAQVRPSISVTKAIGDASFSIDNSGDVSLVPSDVPSVEDEDSSFIPLHSHEAPTIAPLNIPSPIMPGSVKLPATGSPLILSEASATQLRLSSPMLFDLLFSNSMLQTITPTAQTSSDSHVPSPVVHGTTASPTEPNFSSLVNTAISSNGPSALPQENNTHDCQPPPALLDLGASLPTLSNSEEEGLERPTTPEANVARSHDSAFYSLYSSPTSVFTRPAGNVRNNTDSTNDAEAHSLRPTLSQAASSSPKKSALSIGGLTSDSDIIETYANMTTYETDSEEEKMIETAIISTWEAAQLTAFQGSPSEVMSPASLMSSADGEGDDTLSPASTFELMTPTLSLDQRRTSRSQSLSWSPRSRKLSAKQASVAKLLLGPEEVGELVPGVEKLDLGGMLVQDSKLAGYPLADEENMGDDLGQNLAIEHLLFPQVTSTNRLQTLRQRHQNPYPTHLQSRSLPSSPLEPTFPTSRSDPNADSLGRDFARPRPSRGRAGALGQHPFSTTGSEEANRLYSSLNSAIGSPHRGMVGLDARSNREAFLYGQQDDEKFKRKLDLRLANVDASPPRTHEDLDMGAGGGRHVGGPAPKQARSLGLTERALSPLQHGRGGASGNGVTSTPGSAKRLESIVRYQVPLNDARARRLGNSVQASPLRRSNPASAGIPGKRPSTDATFAYIESQAEFESPRPRRRSIASTGVSAPMSPISPPRSAKDISKTLGQKLGLGSKVYEDKENRQSLKSSRPVSMNSTTMDTRLPDVFGAVVSAAAAQGRARSQVRLQDSSAQYVHAPASGLPAPLSTANSRQHITGTRQEGITSQSLPLKKKNPLSLKLSGAKNQLLNPSAHSSMTSLRSRFGTSSRNPSPTTPTSPRKLSSSTLGRPTPEGNTNTHSDSKNFSSRIPRLRSMNNDLVSEDGIIGANASETSWAVRREGGSGVSSRQDPGPTVGVLPGKDGVRPTRTLALRERQFRTARGDVGGLRRVIPARLPRPGGTVLKENDSMAFGARGRGHIVDDPARRDDALFNRF